MVERILLRILMDFLLNITVTIVLFIVILDVCIRLARIQDTMDGAVIIGFIGGILFVLFASNLEDKIRRRIWDG